jgi:hypothetical protein
MLKAVLVEVKIKKRSVDIESSERPKRMHSPTEPGRIEGLFIFIRESKAALLTGARKILSLNPSRSLKIRYPRYHPKQHHQGIRSRLIPSVNLPFQGWQRPLIAGMGSCRE